MTQACCNEMYGWIAGKLSVPDLVGSSHFVPISFVICGSRIFIFLYQV